YEGRKITCRIGFEALARFGNPRARPGEATNTREARWARFEANRAQVHDIAARFIRTGSCEPDGSIGVEANDLPRRCPPGQPLGGARPPGRPWRPVAKCYRRRRRARRG